MPTIDEATPAPPRPRLRGARPARRAAGDARLSSSRTRSQRARDAAYQGRRRASHDDLDWSKRQLAGIGPACRGRRRRGRRRRLRLRRRDAGQGYRAGSCEKLDAVISIPLGSSAVARLPGGLSGRHQARPARQRALGLMPGSDYVSVVSADNFGLGQIAARICPHTFRREDRCVSPSRSTSSRPRSARSPSSKWMRRERPDIVLTQVKFEMPARSGLVVGPYLDCHPDLDGLFVVWDEPAVQGCAKSCVGGASRDDDRRPGKSGGGALIRGDIVKGVAAQRPFEQGMRRPSQRLRL